MVTCLLLNDLLSPYKYIGTYITFQIKQIEITATELLNWSHFNTDSKVVRDPQFLCHFNALTLVWIIRSNSSYSNNHVFFHSCFEFIFESPAGWARYRPHSYKCIAMIMREYSFSIHTHYRVAVSLTIYMFHSENEATGC